MEKKQDLYLRVWKNERVHSGGGYGNVTMDVMTRDSDWSGRQNVGFDFPDDYTYEEYINALGGMWKNWKITLRQPYAWFYGYSEVDFGFGSFENDKADARFKTLKKVERKYNRLVEELGSPQTFEQFCVYVAKAMGVKGFLVDDSTYTIGQMVQERGYRMMSLAEGRTHIHNLYAYE